MLKTICKNMVWVTVPLGLALGCAANRPATEAVYAPAAGEKLTPTSGEPEQRIYSSTGPASMEAVTAVGAPPRGVDASNWTVAEAIREKLLEDQSLAPQGSSLIAQVGKDGAVTLKGRVSSPSEKERVHDTIAKVPGVTSVNDDHLGIGRATGNGTLDMR